MTALTRTRRRVYEDSKRKDTRDEFVLRLLFAIPLLLIANVVGALFPAEEESRRYEGHFGAEPTGKYYDELTEAEHDAIGKFYGGH